MSVYRAKVKALITAMLAIVMNTEASAQQSNRDYAHLFTTPKSYIAHKISTALVIDGKLNEDAWKRAPWSDYFVDIEGDRKPAPAFKTRMKMLWDEKHLYIAAELEEPHIWATLKNHDQVIYHDNDFEIFLDPDGDTHNYYEIEVNAFNTIFDLFLPKAYRNGGRADIKWNSEGLRTAVHIEGTINDPSDLDKRWSVEFAIPFTSLNYNVNAKPEDQTTWRINFSRVQWDVEIQNGIYVKKIDSVKKKPMPEHNWVWSPQGVINMHFPERWGYLQFSDKAPGKKVNFILPESERLKQNLWMIYYRQRDYYQKHRVYASNLSLLDLPEKVGTGDGATASISIEAADKSYRATITSTKSNIAWQIDNEGKTIKSESLP